MAAIVHPRTSSRRSPVRRPVAILAAVVLGLLVLAAVLAPHIAPFAPTDQDLLASYESPSGDHLLGTDGLGRDQLSRLIYGARVSFVAAALAVAVAVGLGVPAGLLSGYVGGLVDTVLSRANDAVMGVPGLVLAITVVAVLGSGITKAMVAVGCVLAPAFFRLSRAAALEVSRTTYVEAAVSMGCRRVGILARHVVPNALPALLIQTCIALGYALLAEGGLSFLGLGVQPPTASWGSMLAVAYQRLDQPYLLYAPGAAICLSVLSISLVGDALHHRITDDRRDDA